MTHSTATGSVFLIDEATPSVMVVIPAEPVPELSPAGIPTIMLIDSGTAGSLALGCRWWPTESELDAARAAVAARLRVPAGELMVTAADLTVDAVALLVATEDGTGPVTLATVVSSGAPPFTALFSVAVTGHLDVVRRACAGEPGLLRIRYTATLRRGSAATTVLTARSAVGGADVEALVAAGVVERVRFAVPGADPAVVAEADRLAAERFAVAASAGGSVRVLATARRPGSSTVVREADVGSWLGSSAGHLLVVAPEEPVVAPARPTRRVAVGFDLTDAPVERIELGDGADRVVLTMPFAPVEVAVAGELAATTFYTDGGPSLRTVVVGDTLTPADLGLVRVTVDASALAATGTTAVELTAYYQPTDRGTPDTRTVGLGPPAWAAAWFVVSRAGELAGELRLRPGPVTPAGSATLPALVTSTVPDVLIQPTPGG